MRSVKLQAVLFSMAWVLQSIASAQQLPAGTVLPVMLETTLDARQSSVGKSIVAKVMQDVPLPDGGRIAKGERLTGRVLSAVPARAGAPSRLSITLDQLMVNGQSLTLTTHLRALASINEVFEAKMPTNAIDDYGTSESDWNTIQIGGAGVFRGSGQVVADGEVVGKSTDYGAVTAKLVAAPRRGCDGDGGREQALWLFSPWACGVYGYGDLKIMHAGRNSPTGEIEFESSRDVRIKSGSGLLLRVNGETPTKSD